VPALIAEVVAAKVPFSFLLTPPQLTRNEDEAINTSPTHIVSQRLRDLVFIFFRRSASGKKSMGRVMPVAAALVAAVVAGTVSLHAIVITYVPVGVIEEVVIVNVPEDCVFGLSL
jgi:hypothetical protein